MKTQSSSSMIWPTTLAGLLGGVMLVFAVLAVPTDAATPSSSTISQAR